MNDDATLVELAKTGDQAAFAELYERYFDRVYDFLVRTVRDSAEAADLTQDAFLKAMNSLPSLTKGASFKSWLFTIARNTALNRLERASRTQPLEGTNDAGEEQSYDVIDTDRYGNPEEAAEASDLASVVWEAAAALDPKYRSVLLLNLREGLDSAEIADVMGVKKNHAYVLVNRMKAALESAVGAVALFRNGRRQCAELDAVIDRLQIGELTPEGRRLIERHAGSCDVCSEQRRKLASPFAIIAGIGLVKPAPGLKESIFSSVQDAFAAMSPNGATGSDTSGLDASSPDGSSLGGLSNAGTGSGTHLPAGASAPKGDDGTAGYPVGTSGHSGGPGAPVGPVAGVSDDGRGRSRKRRIAVIGAAAAILLLITAPVAAVSLFGNSDDTAELAVVVESPTATPAGPTATTAVSPALAPSATATKTPAATHTPTATAAPSATPTPEGSTPVPVAPGDPGLAPGGDGGALPTAVPPTQAPGVTAPPTSTPDAAGPTPGTGPNVVQPDPPTATATAIATATPTVTPVPCSPSMQVSPSELLFNGSSLVQTKTVSVTGSGCGGPLSFTASPGSSWISVSPSPGQVPVGGAATLTVAVSVSPNQPTATGRVIVTSAARTLNVIVNVDLTGPSPTPTRTPFGLRQPGCGVNCIVTPTPTRTPGLGFSN